MAGTANAVQGLSNFEKELICSICTEILYQPLTILDCLHSFCGSCLKEWFSHQHRKASSSRSSAPASSNPYTCPTCRRDVRDVQHNATVSNLLGWFLTEYPDRDRTEQDKSDMREAYRPGEDILPKVERRRERRTRREEHGIATREAQQLEEARLRSLRDLEESSTGNLTPPPTRQSRSASREREERRHRRRERERYRDNTTSLDTVQAMQVTQRESARQSTSPPATSPRHPDAVEARQREQRMVHQASLRSLVSASDSGTGTGDSFDEARIMQEIISEGLLGDIDVDALTEAEQDLLAERIAEEYRQRHPRGPGRRRPSLEHSPPSNSNTTSSSTHLVVRNERRSRSRQSSDSSPIPSRTQDPRPVQQQSHPPSAMIGRSNSASSSVTISHRRKASDHARSNRAVGGSRQSSTERPPTSMPMMSNDSQTHLGRPASGEIRMPAIPRTQTEPLASSGASENWLQTGGEERRQPSADRSPSRSPRQTHTVPVPSVPRTSTSAHSSPALNVVELDSTVVTSPRYNEPCVSCFQCQKPDIQYELHRYCSSCKIDLCMRCYRQGKGCRHWFGFGHAAQTSFESMKNVDEAVELPHVLIGRQYQKPPASVVLETRSAMQTSEILPKTTSSNPLNRLLEGHFCDRCGSFANSQFWICDSCNDGEWGYCKQCVQTHHCCIHPLLPVAYLPPPKAVDSDYLQVNNARPSTLQPIHSNTSSRPGTPRSATSSTTHAHNYDYLSINVNCDNCHNIILPSSSRFHCPFHTTDFDICTSCYESLVHHGRIRRDDGPEGWRKCPAGHRMVILAFQADENGDGGMRRVVKRDLVGGWKMQEADIKAWSLAHPPTSAPITHHTSPPQSPPLTARGTWTWRDDAAPGRKTTRSRASTLNAANGSIASRFPPDGGIGKRARVYYSYWPEDNEDGEGELRLPRGAEVGEIEDVNGDWWSGVYCGDFGVMPFGYFREI